MDKYQPDSTVLYQVVALLQALRDPLCPDHSLALTTLTESCNHLMNKKEDTGQYSFITHMTHIFARGSQYPELSIDLRQLAGLIVKNYFVSIFIVLPPSLASFLNNEILHALTDPLSEVRNTAGTIIGKISTNAIENWIEIIPSLINMLDLSIHGQPLITEGSLIAIKRICEDSNDKLDNAGQGFLDSIISRLILLLDCIVNSNIRLYSLQAMNTLLFQITTQSIGSSHIPNFLSAISKLSTDPVPAIRTGVCQALVTLASIEPLTLQSCLNSVCDFMAKTICDPDETVAKESCEFWDVILADDNMREVMLQYLHVLIPNLISRLRLQEEQLLQERADETAEASGEKAVILKPIHHRNKRDLQEEEELTSKWTLRKQAALLLDNIGTTYHHSVILQPAFNATFSLLSRNDGTEESIWDHETGTLALGALSSCFLNMDDQLPQILRLLLDHLNTRTPELLSITCWAVSRFCEWLFDEGNGDVKAELFRNCVMGLTACMLDGNPRVQAAACSGLDTLIEIACESIVPYGAHILQCCNHAFTHYGVKNTLLIFDTLGVLADNATDLFEESSLIPLYMPHIMRNLSAFEDSDMRITPLLECLSSLTPAMKLNISPFSQTIYNRCLTIIISTFNRSNDDDDDSIPKDIAICCFDVLSGLCEGTGPSFQTLISSTNSNSLLISQILRSIDDSIPEVRQSGFSLAGELCSKCPQLLDYSTILQLTQKCSTHLDPEFPEVCNNASWTLGQIFVSNLQMPPTDRSILLKLMNIINNEEITSTLQQNVAISLGRIALKDPTTLANYISEFFSSWCFALKSLQPSNERNDAFAGLFSVLTCNSQVLFITSENDITYSNAFFFVMACLSWEIEDIQTKPLIDLISMLKHLKSNGQNLWTQITVRLTPQDNNHLNYMIQKG